MTASRLRQHVPKLRARRVLLGLACGFAIILAAPSAGWASGLASSSRPHYNGGPVEKSPQIYIDFWGTWTPDPRGERSYLTDFVSSINGSEWLEILGQYGAGWQHTSYKGSWSDSDLSHRPGPDPDYVAVRDEARRAAHHFGIGYDVNNQIVIALPPGGTCKPYHGWDAINGIVFVAYPYNSDRGCAGGAKTVSHEIAEAMTDPVVGSGWTSPEVADPCNRYAGTVRMPNGKSFYVQDIWSNKRNGCVLQAP